MPNLRATLNELASNFSTAVLAAIRGASLDELVAEGGGARRRSPGRPRGSSTKSGATAGRAPGPVKTKGGRLQRRTPEQIAKTLASIVSFVKTKKAGLRSEEIRAALKLDKREMPRVLGQGLAKKVLKSRGQKRATTYFAT